LAGAGFCYSKSRLHEVFSTASSLLQLRKLLSSSFFVLSHFEVGVALRAGVSL
jgi:hypothetical protein